jgi:hypothetical protein
MKKIIALSILALSLAASAHAATPVMFTCSNWVHGNEEDDAVADSLCGAVASKIHRSLDYLVTTRSENPHATLVIITKKLSATETIASVTITASHGHAVGEGSLEIWAGSNVYDVWKYDVQHVAEQIFQDLRDWTPSPRFFAGH